MKVLRYFVLWTAILLLVPSVAGAYDRVLHSDVVYAIAIAHGFKPEEAALIADASQSLDDNISTTAFSEGLIYQELSDLRSGAKSLDRLPHMISGQIYHALSGSKSREIVEEAHLKRISQALDAEKKAAKVSEKQESLALVYLGEYLHFLADTVVHPEDTLLGHLTRGSDPDRGDRHPQELRIATSLISRQLALYKKGSPLAKTTPSAALRPPKLLDNDPGKNRFLEEVARTVEDSWRKTYPDELPYLLKKPGLSLSDWPSVRLFEKAALQSAGLGQAPELVRKFGSTYLELWDEARKARAHSEIGRVMKQFGYLAPEHRYRTINLAANGNPTGAHANRFGRPAKLDSDPFANNLAENKVLKDERSLNAGIAAIRVAVGSLNPALLPVQLSTEILQQARKAPTWRPPAGPGGIALDPGLVMPGGLGKPVRITLDGAALVLVTTKGRYVFKDIDPRSFATLARTVSSGEVPSITIGTIPSERDGYARVLYSPSLIGTWEGAALYDSDVLFKALFSRLPFGPDYVFNHPKSALYRAFPGSPQGGSMRLWITSKRVVLEERGGVLVPAHHGMRILSETFLDGRPQEDPEMEAYAAKLTAEWDRLAEKIWPFRAVEDMARATAIVFWARSESVPIDPMIFTLPPRTGSTPTYAPVIGAVGRNSLDLAGGVALTPEDKSSSSGRLFFNWVRSTILAQGRQEVHPTLVTALVVLSCMGVALAFLFACSLAFRGVCRLFGYPRLSRGRTLQVWVVACAVDFILSMAIYPLVREGGPLCYFDADMLAFFATVVAFPCLLFAILSRSGSREAPSSAWIGRALLIALGLLGPVCNAMLGEALALATAALSKPVPGPVMNAVLTYELAPASVWSQGFSAMTFHREDGPRVFFLPRSLLHAQRPPFENYGPIPSSNAQHITGENVRKNPSLPIHLPFTTLHRITWPGGMPLPDGFVHYSPEGNRPFEFHSSRGRVELAHVNRFEILRVLDSPKQDAREVIHKEGGFSETLWVEPEPLLEDSDFVRAELSGVGDSFWVNIILSAEGAEKFSEVTTEYVGERLGIFIMGRLVIAPRVASPIKDGVIQIAGGMNKAEAARIVEELNRK